MLRSALSRGQGSTICVIILVATALPPDLAMVSRRSRYSEQPPSTARKAPSARLRRTLLNDRIGAPLRQIKHVSGKWPVAGNRDTSCGRCELACQLPRDFGLAQQEEIDVVRRQRIVGRRLD